MAGALRWGQRKVVASDNTDPWANYVTWEVPFWTRGRLTEAKKRKLWSAIRKLGRPECGSSFTTESVDVVRGVVTVTGRFSLGD